MDAGELARRHPFLFHMAEAGSWESAARHGLLSTSALLDLYEVAPAARKDIESRIRPCSVTISHPEHGTAVIRDNKPLRSQFLRLDQMTESEWCEFLNQHVFLWPSEERLLVLLSAKAYRDLEHDVITVATEELMERHRANVRLVRLNSGSTLYPNAPRRGRGTFQEVEDFDASNVVEIAVEGGIPDISEIAVRVERRQRAKVLHTIYQR